MKREGAPCRQRCSHLRQAWDRRADDALELRHRVLERFERAAADPAMIERGELNVVLCGGGPTGVETAGAMMELFTKVLAKDFPTLDVHAARVILVESGAHAVAPRGTHYSRLSRLHKRSSCAQ